MKKFLVVLVVGFIVATGASYFGMQWKVQKSVDNFFSSLFFVDASYEKASIDLNGQIILRNIELFEPTSQLTLNIGSVGIATGGFWNTLSLEKNLENGQLPETLKLNIRSFSMDLDSQMLETADQLYQPGINEQLLTLGCGRYASLGLEQYFAMGLRNLTFDLSVGYDFDLPTDEFVSTVDFYLDGIGHLVVDQTYIGLGNVMQNYQSVMLGFDPASVTPVNLDIQYVDLGFNAKKRDFCAQASGMEKDAWLELNRTMIAAALNEFSFQSDFDAIKLYADLVDERSRVNVNLTPLSGFNLSDLEFYDVSKLVELLDLDVRVNNEVVEIGSVSWDQEKLNKLNLANIRKEFRVGPKDDSVEEETSQEQSGQARILKEVPVSELDQYLYRNVLLERKDGKTFTGELTSVTASQVVVRTRFRSGYTDLPLIRNEISVAKLYPED